MKGNNGQQLMLLSRLLSLLIGILLAAKGSN